MPKSTAPKRRRSRRSPPNISAVEKTAVRILRKVYEATSGRPQRWESLGNLGRYTYKLTLAEIVNLYRLTLPDEESHSLKPSYNVAPTYIMPIIRPAYFPGGVPLVPPEPELPCVPLPEALAAALAIVSISL
jgi:hypothetical protein